MWCSPKLNPVVENRSRSICAWIYITISKKLNLCEPSNWTMYEYLEHASRKLAIHLHKIDKCITFSMRGWKWDDNKVITVEVMYISLVTIAINGTVINRLNVWSRHILKHIWFIWWWKLCNRTYLCQIYNMWQSLCFAHRNLTLLLPAVSAFIV